MVRVYKICSRNYFFYPFLSSFFFSKQFYLFSAYKMVSVPTSTACVLAHFVVPWCSALIWLLPPIAFNSGSSVINYCINIDIEMDISTFPSFIGFLRDHFPCKPWCFNTSPTAEHGIQNNFRVLSDRIVPMSLNAIEIGIWFPSGSWHTTSRGKSEGRGKGRGGG